MSHREVIVTRNLSLSTFTTQSVITLKNINLPYGWSLSTFVSDKFSDLYNMD